MAVRPTFTILLPTTARPTLATRTLRSIVGQLLPGDEVLCVCGPPTHDAKRMFDASHLPGRFIELEQRGGDWGHWERNQTMRLARTTHLLHIDDDDEYVPGAMAVIRAAVAAEPDRPHMFRMLAQGARWPDEARNGGDLISPGNAGTPNIVHPVGMRGTWQSRRGGDGDFIRETCAMHPMGPVIHDDITVLVNGSMLP